MNVEEVSEQLRQDPSLIIKVLVKLGFPEEKIKYRASNNMISSPRPEEGADNMQGFILYCDSLWWKYNTRTRWHIGQIGQFAHGYICLRHC